MIRLQKVIAKSGYTSRRKAEELIKRGRVLVNGKVVQELGTKVSKEDIIVVNGLILKQEQKVYYLFYKPRGVVTTVKDDKKRKTVLDFFPLKERIYPVGRLDYHTSGLLLLTNDGELTNYLLHPKNEIEKVYLVKIKGIVDNKIINQLKKGVFIDGSISKAKKIKVNKKDLEKQISFLEITIHEGKNHQVKKMFNKVGLDVLKLKRICFSFLNLKGLKTGEYRKLTIREIKKLFRV
ncbi:MAG: pseudouridine synthase [Bacilli bacterium]